MIPFAGNFMDGCESPAVSQGLAGPRGTGARKLPASEKYFLLPGIKRAAGETKISCPTLKSFLGIYRRLQITIWFNCSSIDL